MATENFKGKLSINIMYNKCILKIHISVMIKIIMIKAEFLGMERKELVRDKLTLRGLSSGISEG